MKKEDRTRFVLDIYLGLLFMSAAMVLHSNFDPDSNLLELLKATWFICCTAAVIFILSAMCDLTENSETRGSNRDRDKFWISSKLCIARTLPPALIAFAIAFKIYCNLL